MNREELIILADKILNKEASEAEINTYNTWYNDLQQSGEILISDEEAQKSILYARILSVIDKDLPAERIGAKTLKYKIRIWSAAAAAVAAMAICIYFFNAAPNTDKNKSTDLVAGSKVIKPGRNTAKLTLANGKSIELSEAKTGVVIDVSGLKYADETKITSTTGNDIKDGGIMNVATPRGGTYQIILSDGSKVWLNAASSIKFPASFIGEKRRSVELVGEAYFEIAKNANQKFVVTTKNQEVEVLGTHFNVNSYLDERDVKTTLLEGSVRVSLSKQEGLGSEVVLNPGQQSVVSTSKLSVTSVDVNDIVAWKEGKFVFVRENVTSIMNKIARWYDVEIIYEGDVRRKALGGSVSRFKNVSEVLEMLSATKAVQFRIEGRNVIVMPFKDK